MAIICLGNVIWRQNYIWKGKTNRYNFLKKKSKLQEFLFEYTVKNTQLLLAFFLKILEIQSSFVEKTKGNLELYIS